MAWLKINFTCLTGLTKLSFNVKVRILCTALNTSIWSCIWLGWRTLSAAYFTFYIRLVTLVLSQSVSSTFQYFILCCWCDQTVKLSFDAVLCICVVWFILCATFTGFSFKVKVKSWTCTVKAVVAVACEWSCCWAFYCWQIWAWCVILLIFLVITNCSIIS